MPGRLWRTIGEPFDLDGHQVMMETSIGVALVPTHGRDADQLLKNADLALYRAKADGRNTFRLFEPPMESEARLHLSIRVSQVAGQAVSVLAQRPRLD